MSAQCAENGDKRRTRLRVDGGAARRIGDRGSPPADHLRPVDLELATDDSAIVPTERHSPHGRIVGKAPHCHSQKWRNEAPAARSPEGERAVMPRPSASCANADDPALAGHRRRRDRSWRDATTVACTAASSSVSASLCVISFCACAAASSGSLRRSVVAIEQSFQLRSMTKVAGSDSADAPI